MHARWDDRGITTVEWLGMATIAVIVIAVLLPSMRQSALELWNSLVAQLNGL